MVLKDNYFGSFTHYSTLAEFLEKQKAGEPLGDPVLKKYREGQVRFFMPLSTCSTY